RCPPAPGATRRPLGRRPRRSRSVPKRRTTGTPRRPGGPTTPGRPARRPAATSTPAAPRGGRTRKFSAPLPRSPALRSTSSPRRGRRLPVSATTEPDARFAAAKIPHPSLRSPRPSRFGDVYTGGAPCGTRPDRGPARRSAGCRLVFILRAARELVLNPREHRFLQPRVHVAVPDGVGQLGEDVSAHGADDDVPGFAGHFRQLFVVHQLAGGEDHVVLRRRRRRG